MSHVAEAWSAAVQQYRNLWPALNRPLVEGALPHLPDFSAEGLLHLAGVGGGEELPLIAPRVDLSRAVVSDISAHMLLGAREIGENQPVPPRHYLQADLHAPPLRELAGTLSLFVLHLVRRPLDALQAQWTSLASGGRFAALYFPPTPIAQGPLAALHRAARSLAPKPDNPWESEALTWLRAARAQQVQRREITAPWRFDRPEAFRDAMECLPHITGIRDRAGEAFYETLWATCLADPGLNRQGETWVGDVSAVLLTARKP